MKVVVISEERDISLGNVYSRPIQAFKTWEAARSEKKRLETEDEKIVESLGTDPCRYTLRAVDLCD